MVPIKIFRRYVIVSLFGFFLITNLFSFAPPAHAQVWGAVNIFSDLMIQIVETVKKQIEGAILGTLKVAAIEIINSKVGQMIGGSTAGNARFVTDWNEFLYVQPAQEVQLFMNDFFSTATKGKYAQTNYVGIGDRSSDVSGNYPTYLVERSKQAIGGDEQTEEMTYNLDDYTASPDEMFASGDFRALGSFFSNPLNNPFGFSDVAQQKYREELNKKVELLKTEQQSSGYKAPKDANGNTIAPLATLEGMQKDAMNIGNQLIAAATNPGEFLAGVVGAMVNKTITNIVQRGVGKVQASIKKEINAFDNKVAKEVNRIDKQLGPAAKYLKETSQRVDTKVKPYTKPPPQTVDCIDRSVGAC